MDREQVLSLAPDTASVKAADKLASTSKWPLLQFSAAAIWGECQGSGSKPYQTRIDRNGNAFKCSCPSRKFPCKHGLALYLLFVDEQQAFSEGAAPAWVSEWLESRSVRAEKQAEKKQQAKPVDEKAQAKRREKRADNVAQGVNELKLWLEDAVRMGFAELQAQSFQYWDNLAARMVDAQAPGLANRIRRLGSLLYQKGDPMPIFMADIARLHLLLQAYERRDQLPEALQAEVMSLVGWPTTEAEVMQTPLVSDTWHVLGQRIVEEENLLRQDIWLFGETQQRFAKQLNFTHPSQRHTLNSQWVVGDCFVGDVHFYPAATPRRVRVAAAEKTIASAPEIKPYSPLDHFRELKIKNPWLDDHPAIFTRAQVQAQNDNFQLHWQQQTIAIHSAQSQCWKMLALSGGGECDVFGEWNGQRFTPIGMWMDGQYTSLIQTERAG